MSSIHGASCVGVMCPSSLFTSLQKVAGAPFRPDACELPQPRGRWKDCLSGSIFSAGTWWYPCTRGIVLEYLAPGVDSMTSLTFPLGKA